MEILIRIAAAGLSAAGVAALFRALPWPERWLRRKPWSCSACTGAWSAMLVLMTGLFEWPGVRNATLLWFGATAVAAVVHRYLYPPELDFGQPDVGRVDTVDAATLSRSDDSPST